MDCSETMNIQLALDELEIIFDEVQMSTITKEYVKKKYHKLALKWHPDKNTSECAKEKFQKITNAYNYLCKELECFDNENLINPSVNVYVDLLTHFISSLLNGSCNDILLNILQDIASKYETITMDYLKNKFKNLGKQESIELFHLLNKYKTILNISGDTLEFVSLIIKERYKNDCVFILKPTLKDIIEHNVYKLYVDKNMYLVPLWHSELYFDAPDGSEIIVLCQPILPDNISIDENNNIIYDICIKLDLDFIKNNKLVDINVGEKLFSVPLHKLHIKEEQMYILKYQGISHITEKNMYSIKNKADIIVNIRFI